MRNYLVLALILGIFGGVSEGQVRWSQFRGVSGLGVAADEKELPVEFGKSKNLIWRCELPKGISSPCIYGDRIFVTSYAAGKLETIGIDRGTGEILWRQAAEAEKIERVHQVSSPAVPTAATDGERIYVYFGSYGLLCYDFEGKEVWNKPLPMPVGVYGTGSSPILAGDTLILNCDSAQDSYMIALKCEDGETVWKIDRSQFIDGWATPMYWKRGEVEEVIVMGTTRLVAYDLKDGSERWSVAGLTDVPCCTAVRADGTLFITSFNMGRNPEIGGITIFDKMLEKYDENDDKQLDFDEIPGDFIILPRVGSEGEGDIPLNAFYPMLDESKDKQLSVDEWKKLEGFLEGMNNENALMAIKPGGGEEKAGEILWRYNLGVPEVPSPLYYQGRVYMVMSGGLVSCVDAVTGEQKFQGKLGASGAYYSSPVAGDGKIYVASIRGDITVFEAGDELKVLAKNLLRERTSATPAIVDGVIYVRTEKALYAFGLGN
ncbi:MAG: PQQ-binding-like beta-propeller repeat protein [Planctomycetes bacterium]|nr:PQQ-binding-like beta-propeller repeat protein [Planctomycetota bacterium]